MVERQETVTEAWDLATVFSHLPCMNLHGCWGPDVGPPWELCAVLSADPTLQPLHVENPLYIIDVSNHLDTLFTDKSKYL